MDLESKYMYNIVKYIFQQYKKGADIMSMNGEMQLFRHNQADHVLTLNLNALLQMGCSKVEQFY